MPRGGRREKERKQQGLIRQRNTCKNLDLEIEFDLELVQTRYKDITTQANRSHNIHPYN